MNKLYNAQIIVRIIMKLVLLAPIGAAVISLDVGAELARRASAAINKHVGI